MSRTVPPRLAILGAGPIGLEAALHAATHKFPFAVFERGQPAEHVRRWGHVRLFSPFGLNTTPLGLDALRSDQPRRDLPGESDILTGRDHVSAYLQPLATLPLLRKHIHTETTVLHIGRRGFLKEEGVGDPRRAQQPFRLLVRDAAGRERIEEADVVLDCTGTYGQPRWLGDGGIPALGELSARAHIASGLEDVLGERRKAYADKTTLVVGAGHSAASTVCLLANLAEQAAGTWVVWLARGPGSQPLKRLVNDPLRERDLLCGRANMLATRGDGAVEFHPQTVVEAIECAGPDAGFKVHGRCGSEERSWQVDRVLANVGHSPDTELYRELQVHEVPSESAGALRHPEPNFFILGAKGHGRNTHFLLRTGFEQVREVFALLAGPQRLTRR